MLLNVCEWSGSGHLREKIPVRGKERRRHYSRGLLLKLREWGILTCTAYDSLRVRTGCQWHCLATSVVARGCSCGTMLECSACDYVFVCVTRRKRLKIITAHAMKSHAPRSSDFENVLEHGAIPVDLLPREESP